MLQIENLTVEYRQPHGTAAALRGIDLTIAAGARVGVLGESGSGKTTLARTIAGILPQGAAVRGQVKWLGQALRFIDAPLWRRRTPAGISTIFQEPRQFLNPVRRAGSQIREIALAPDALSRAGIDSRIASSYPFQLSGGECQRVAIAQALALESKLLIADEPTASLDACAQARVFEELKKFPAALLLISHNPAAIAAVVQTAAVMYAGQIVESGPVGDVLRSPLHPYTQMLLRREPSAGHPNQRGCAFRSQCPARLPACADADPTVRYAAPGRAVRCLLYGE